MCETESTNAAENTASAGNGTIRLGRDTGRWGFTTSSGADYVLDLDAMTCTRLRGDGPTDWTSPWPNDRLRRDGETVVLLDFQPIQVGHDAFLVLHGVADEIDVSTNRRTTPVVALYRLPDEE